MGLMHIRIPVVDGTEANCDVMARWNDDIYQESKGMSISGPHEAVERFYRTFKENISAFGVTDATRDESGNALTITFNRELSVTSIKRKLEVTAEALNGS